MIGDNGSNADSKAPWKIALEDAAVIAVYTFFGGLIATQSSFPPDVGVLYATALVAAMAGVLSWAKARNVPLPATP